MLIRRLMLLLFLCTQVAVAAAVPADPVMAEAAGTEHCAGQEAAEDVPATHADCDEGCQQCAACAPGLAVVMSAAGGGRIATAALVNDAAEPAGALTAPFRPPARS